MNSEQIIDYIYENLGYVDEEDMIKHIDQIIKIAVYKRTTHLEETLRQAQQDINWMLNNQKFLNGFVFDYIEDALKETK